MGAASLLPANFFKGRDKSGRKWIRRRLSMDSSMTTGRIVFQIAVRQRGQFLDTQG
ncbi:MAG: hypothetical protein ABJZ55_19810 [Fuerstiella sp.]